MHDDKQDTTGPPLLPIKFKYVRQCSPRVSQWKCVALDLSFDVVSIASRSRHADDLRRRREDTAV